MNYAGLPQAGVVVAARRLDRDATCSRPRPRRATGARSSSRVMRRFRTGVPWEAVVHSWPLLDSHDTARFATVVGRSRDVQHVGVGLLMTTPGVPMIFAGDELGLEGRVGRGRPPHDAVGAIRRSWDDDDARRLPRARRAAPLERRARARRHPLPARLEATPSPTCARRAASGCSASRHAPRTIRSPRRSRTSKRSTAATHATACCRPTAPRSTSGGSS